MADYKNMFSLIGNSDDEVKERLNQLFHTIFFDEEERFYFDTPCGTMGYMLDILGTERYAKIAA